MGGMSSMHARSTGNSIIASGVPISSKHLYIFLVRPKDLSASPSRTSSRTFDPLSCNTHKRQHINVIKKHQLKNLSGDHMIGKAGEIAITKREEEIKC